MKELIKIIKKYNTPLTINQLLGINYKNRYEKKVDYIPVETTD